MDQDKYRWIRLDSVNERYRRIPCRVAARSKDVEEKAAFRLLEEEQTGYPKQRAQTEWPSCESRGKMYGKKRHKEIRGRREEGEGNHSNPNAPMFTDELYVLMGDGKKERR